jgi:hypothetical protein
MPTELSAANLEAISAFAAVPRYRRSDLKAGIVHFGVGNFHRAHQAVYLDELFNPASTTIGPWSARAFATAISPCAPPSRPRTG